MHAELMFASGLDGLNRAPTTARLAALTQDVLQTPFLSLQNSNRGCSKVEPFSLQLRQR